MESLHRGDTSGEDTSIPMTPRPRAAADTFVAKPLQDKSLGGTGLVKTVGGLTFSSAFDSANLKDVKLSQQNSEDGQGAEQANPLEFDLTIACDCEGTPHRTRNSTWFYFSVRGMSRYTPQVLKFKIVNMNRQPGLYRAGFKPVVRSVPSKRSWEKIKTAVQITDLKDEGRYEVAWEYSWVPTLPSADSQQDKSRRKSDPNGNTAGEEEEELFFAFTYPYGYDESQRDLQELDRRFACPPPRLVDIDALAVAQPTSTAVSTAISAAAATTAGDAGVADAAAAASASASALLAKDLRSLPISHPARWHKWRRPRSLKADDVFYHRELLGRSLDGRRLDLVTISDWSGLLNDNDSENCGGVEGHQTDRKSVGGGGGGEGSSSGRDSASKGNRSGICESHEHLMVAGNKLLNLSPSTSSSSSQSKDAGGGGGGGLSVEAGGPVPKSSDMHVSGCFFPECWQGLRAHAPQFHSKPTVLLSARVHPGETPASFSFSAALGLLTHPTDCRAIALRKAFVFKLVPMLNPDGVARGHYRQDNFGNNLNRYYADPSPLEQPTIFAVKEALRMFAFMPSNAHLLRQHSRTCRPRRGSREKKEREEEEVRCSPYETESDDDFEQKVLANRGGRVALYVDMHAHATKKGCFIYGNSLDSLTDQVENQTFAALLAVNSAHFEYDACNFSRQHMETKDKNGETAEGSGRVGMFKASGLIHSYTLECNYNTGKVLNHVPAAQGGHGGRASPEREATTPPKYSPEDWGEVGRGVLFSLLDLYGLNPWSRVGTSRWRTVDKCRNGVCSEIRNQKQYQKQSLEKRMTSSDRMDAGIEDGAGRKDNGLLRRQAAQKSGTNQSSKASGGWALASERFGIRRPPPATAAAALKSSSSALSSTSGNSGVVADAGEKRAGGARGRVQRRTSNKSISAPAKAIVAAKRLSTAPASISESAGGGLDEGGDAGSGSFTAYPGGGGVSGVAGAGAGGDGSGSIERVSLTLEHKEKNKISTSTRISSLGVEVSAAKTINKSGAAVNTKRLSSVTDTDTPSSAAAAAADPSLFLSGVKRSPNSRLATTATSLSLSSLGNSDDESSAHDSCNPLLVPPPPHPHRYSNSHRDLFHEKQQQVHEHRQQEQLEATRSWIHEQQESPKNYQNKRQSTNLCSEAFATLTTAHDQPWTTAVGNINDDGSEATARAASPPMPMGRRQQRFMRVPDNTTTQVDFNQPSVQNEEQQQEVQRALGSTNEIQYRPYQPRQIKQQPLTDSSPSAILQQQRETDQTQQQLRYQMMSPHSGFAAFDRRSGGEAGSAAVTGGCIESEISLGFLSFTERNGKPDKVGDDDIGRSGAIEGGGCSGGGVRMGSGVKSTRVLVPRYVSSSRAASGSGGSHGLGSSTDEKGHGRGTRISNKQTAVERNWPRSSHIPRLFGVTSGEEDRAARSAGEGQVTGGDVTTPPVVAAITSRSFSGRDLPPPPLSSLEAVSSSPSAQAVSLPSYAAMSVPRSTPSVASVTTHAALLAEETAHLLHRSKIMLDPQKAQKRGGRTAVSSSTVKDIGKRGGGSKVGVRGDVRQRAPSRSEKGIAGGREASGGGSKVAAPSVAPRPSAISTLSSSVLPPVAARGLEPSLGYRTA